MVLGWTAAAVWSSLGFVHRRFLTSVGLMRRVFGPAESLFPAQIVSCRPPALTELPGIPPDGSPPQPELLITAGRTNPGTWRPCDAAPPAHTWTADLFSLVSQIQVLLRNSRSFSSRPPPTKQRKKKNQSQVFCGLISIKSRASASILTTERSASGAVWGPPAGGRAA